MARSVDVHIDKEHGETCTCRKLDPITFQPVIVDDECPGRFREHFGTVTKLFEPIPHGGRIVITWPAPAGDGIPLISTKMRVHGYDTGEQIATATGLRIILGGTSWNGEAIKAELTMLVDKDDKPLAGGARPVVAEDGKNVRTAVFQYDVVEMRVEAPQP